MRKGIILAILLFVGLNEGRKYILSEKFQAYGDREKAQWTCYVNNIVGEFFFALSRYKRASGFFERIIKRCPKTRLEEKASFKIASCAEADGNNRLAFHLYRDFHEKFPKSKRAKLAWKKMSVLER